MNAEQARLDQDKNGVDLTAGLGVGRYVYEFPVSSVLDVIELEDFTRWQFDLPILIGNHSDYHRFWAGPRLMGTTFGTELVYNAYPIPGLPERSAVLASVSGTSCYLGAQSGIAVGYKKVFVGFELTIVQALIRAELEAFGRRREFELGGLIIYPALGLLGEF